METTMNSHGKPTVVLGEGWAALGTVGLLCAQGYPVVWVSGSGARVTAPLPVLEASEVASGGLRGWLGLASGLGIGCGPVETGSFLREFRNKAFREMPWSSGGTPELRREVRAESLWAPETRIAPLFEARAMMSVGEIEEAVRLRLTEDRFACLRKIEKTPVVELCWNEDRLESALLGNGENIPCGRFIFADRWSTFGTIAGVPERLRKKVSALRRREPVGVLQAVMTHKNPIGAGMSEGFCGNLNKDPGEQQERKVWGYFSSDGRKSYWTVCLSSEEVEDNHEITKKLRRMKSALEKMFVGLPWLSEEQTTFSANVEDEQVRLAESLLFSNGEYEAFRAEFEPLIAQCPEVVFMTDGFGPSVAMQQVAEVFGETGVPATLPATPAFGESRDAEEIR